MTTRAPRLVLAMALAVALLAVPAIALAATRHGVTPLAPRAGATVPAGKSPTFRVRLKGKGSVWIYVCKSRKRDRRGLICDDEMVERATRSGDRAKLKPRFFDYPGFWLNSPGTYYWQAHRIRCERGDTKDCAQEGPVVKIKVG